MLKQIKSIFSYFYIRYVKLKKYISYTFNIILISLKVLHKARRIWIFDCADYANIGDLAISKTEIEFLQEVFPKHYIIATGMAQFSIAKHILFPLVKNKDIIFLHGGGNVGNFYKRGENLRRIIIKRFPHNHIILFPQTIYFSKDKEGQNEFEITKKIYSSHKKLLLSARESISYQTFINNFKNQVVLIPDIVFLLKIPPLQKKREGALICLRNDIESILTQKEKTTIIKLLESKFNRIEHTDTVGDSSSNAVINKINLFQEKELIITDRIHGMIFAAISGTPCIVLSNYNHKVIGTYNWLIELDYIRLAKSIKDIEKHLSDIDLQKTYTYNNQSYRNLFYPLLHYINNLQ